MKITKTQLRQIIKEEILNEVNSDKKLQELFGVGKKIKGLGRRIQQKAGLGEVELKYVGKNPKAMHKVLQRLSAWNFKGDKLGSLGEVIEQMENYMDPQADYDGIINLDQKDWEDGYERWSKEAEEAQKKYPEAAKLIANVEKIISNAEGSTSYGEDGIEGEFDDRLLKLVPLMDELGI